MVVSSSASLVLVTATMIHKKIIRLTLNNVKKKNALSYAMLQQMQIHLDRIDKNPNIHVVIINASSVTTTATKATATSNSNNNGPVPAVPVFSSGHDLEELRRLQTHINTGNGNNNSNNNNNNETALSFTNIIELCSSVMKTIVQLKKPVIAQVDGIATAAGCQLVASCDLAYASQRSQFSTPGVNIGLFCSTPAVALSRCVPSRKHAMAMLLTGDMISAKEAERIGLINAVIDIDNRTGTDTDCNDDNNNNNKNHLDDAVLEIAIKIASKSSQAIEIGKPLFYKQLEMSSLDGAYQLASKTMVDQINNCDDTKEGIDAFLTKRKPKWS